MAKPGLRKIKNYGIEFKLRAVQLSIQPGVMIKDVADSLGIRPFMLSKWRKQVRDGELTGDPPPVAPQDQAVAGISVEGKSAGPFPGQPTPADYLVFLLFD
jgi:transposase-like protein